MIAHSSILVCTELHRALQLSLLVGRVWVQWGRWHDEDNHRRWIWSGEIMSSWNAVSSQSLSLLNQANKQQHFLCSPQASEASVDEWPQIAEQKKTLEDEPIELWLLHTNALLCFNKHLLVISPAGVSFCVHIGLNDDGSHTWSSPPALRGPPLWTRPFWCAAPFPLAALPPASTGKQRCRRRRQWHGAFFFFFCFFF